METTNNIDPANPPARKLYKSRRNRFIDGVCGGIAEYFEVDPTIVRLLWVMITLLGGSGIILYIVGMIVMPVNPEHLMIPQPTSATQASTTSADRRRFFGILVMLIGAFILMINLGWFESFSWWGFSRTVTLPVLLILIGGFFIYMHTTKDSRKSQQPGGAEAAGSGNEFPPVRKEFRRSISDRKLFGVCGGLAKYFSMDSTIVRLIFVLMVLGSVGWALLLYIILGVIVHEEKPTMTSI